MALTQEEINEYLYGVRSAFVDYGFKLARYEQLGKKDIIQDTRFKFRLLQYFIRIVIDYFDAGTPEYETINFFTTDEIRDVIQHINNICGTNYMLDFSK